MKKTDVEDLSDFGKFCDAQGLSEVNIMNIMDISYNYTRMLMRGDKPLKPFWVRFFYEVWDYLPMEAKEILMSKPPKK